MTVGLAPASIVINEIMYAPISPEQEWLELFNVTGTVIDLSNFKIATRGGSEKIKVGSLIPPLGFVVLCKDSSAALLHYPIHDLVIQPVPSLNNSGDWVAIYDSFGNLLDSIDYIPSYGGADGKSLERIDYLAGSDSTNWHESLDSTGATPGMTNSVAKLPFDACLKRMRCQSMLDVGGHCNINLVVQNVGRNALNGITATLDACSEPDGAKVFSDEQSIAATLAPGDTALGSFVFTPSRPGGFRILGNLSTGR